MPTPVQFKAPFEPDQFYHVVFRSIDGVKLFLNNNQKQIFLNKWIQFMQPFCRIWAYCLLENHVHLVLKIEKAQSICAEIEKWSEDVQTKAIQNYLSDKSESHFDEMLERQVNRFLVSYVNTFNNEIVRKGGLFQKPFRHVLIVEEAHLQQAIVYVHANAQKHGIVKDYLLHPDHSYHEIIKGTNLYVDSSAVVDFFGNKTAFISVHKEQVDYFYSRNWAGSRIE